MLKFLKSIFSGGSPDDSGGAPADRGGPSEPDTASPSSEAAPDAPVRAFSREQIISDLVAQVCTTMPDPRPFEEIDTQVHMYDAGYVTSISAADLLAHIESRYGVDISETKLIGPLQNLEALASHIESELN